jgi:hypothetical protein
VDIMTKRRLAEGREDGAALPGALWHIFDACDSDAIRDLLNKVAEEIGEPVEADHDPIHDQVRAGSGESSQQFVGYQFVGYLVQYVGNLFFALWAVSQFYCL